MILGGGPAGNTAATVAATLGAEVTLIERDIVGGAAHLWDCIPSKAMIATGGELSELTRARVMGLRAEGSLDFDALRERVASIEARLHESVRSLLESQGVRMIAGTGRLVSAYTVAVETEDGTEEIDADAILLATGIATARFPIGSSPTASASSRPARRTRRRRSPSISSWSGRASPVSSSRTCSARSGRR